VPAHQPPIKMLPSEYFRRQCLISADPESVTTAMVEHIGASFGVVRELKERLAPVPEEASRKVLGLNARRLLPASELVHRLARGGRVPTRSEACR
jgi:hypothetical protein